MTEPRNLSIELIFAHRSLPVYITLSGVREFIELRGGSHFIRMSNGQRVNLSRRFVLQHADTCAPHLCNIEVMDNRTMSVDSLFEGQDKLVMRRNNSIFTVRIKDSM